MAAHKTPTAGRNEARKRLRAILGGLADPAVYLWSAYLFGLALLLAYHAAR